MSFNAWSPQGLLTGLTTKSNPSVIFEGNPQILAGNVFKMWCGAVNGGFGIFYYESLDGITSWTAHPSNPVQSTDSFPTVYHIGSTYYMYTGATTLVQVRTSADGITWSAPTQVIGIGGVGAWDHTLVAQLNIVPGTPGYGTGTGETYYGYYEGNGAGGSALGLVTTTNLAGAWTKDAGNPFFTGAAPGTFQKVGSTYYMWAPSGGVAIAASNMRRWSASAPNGPWTVFQVSSVNVSVNYCSIPADLNADVTTAVANQGDPCILEVAGSSYFYWTKTKPGGLQLGICASVATGSTLARLVGGIEGVVNFPSPGLTVNLSPVASDAFQRADANPIGGNWTPIVAGKTLQLASNLVEPSAISTDSDSYWNAASFPNDQYSKVTIQTVTGSFAGADARMNTSGVFTCYRGLWNGTLGSPGTLSIAKKVAGVTTTLNSYTVLTLNVGDTLMLCVSGSSLLLYWNGGPLVASTDATIASGPAGIEEFAATLVTNSQISAWSAGGFQAAPGSGGSSSWTQQQMFHRRRD